MGKIEEQFPTDFAKLGPVLAEVAAEKVASSSPVEFQGLNFYGSHGPGDKGRKFNRWAN